MYWAADRELQVRAEGLGFRSLGVRIEGLGFNGKSHGKENGKQIQRWVYVGVI